MRFFSAMNLIALGLPLKLLRFRTFGGKEACRWKAEISDLHFFINSIGKPVKIAMLWVGLLALAFLHVPLRAADSSEPHREWSGTLDYKEDFRPLSEEIVKRSKVSLINLVREFVATPSSKGVNLHFAEALSVDTEGIPRKEWEATLVSELSQAIDQLLKQTKDGLNWPAFDISVEGAATSKTARGSKTHEFPEEPIVKLGTDSFPEESPELEHTAEAGPLRLQFGIRKLRATPEMTRWRDAQMPKSLLDGSSVTTSFLPRYRLDLSFVVSLVESPESIVGGGSIALWGAARTVELQAPSDPVP